MNLRAANRLSIYLSLGFGLASVWLGVSAYRTFQETSPGTAKVIRIQTEEFYSPNVITELDLPNPSAVTTHYRHTVEVEIPDLPSGTARGFLYLSERHVPAVGSSVAVRYRKVGDRFEIFAGDLWSLLGSAWIAVGVSATFAIVSTLLSARRDEG